MLTVIPIRAFRDNYIWGLHNGRQAVIVDPGDAMPVEAFLARHNLELVAVLATHHHADHVGGIADLVADRAIPVYGPHHEPITTLTDQVGECDSVVIDALGLNFSVIDIPGHTAGHIAYHGNGMLFCGDTLFACGCGRLFEGTPAQMVLSLAKLAALPENTLVYCGHEYTLANIRFAKTVEPDLLPLLRREVTESLKQQRDEPTLPSTIGLELATNPFLRCRETAVIEAVSRYTGRQLTNDIDVFAALREWKNQS